MFTDLRISIVDAVLANNCCKDINDFSNRSNLVFSYFSFSSMRRYLEPREAIDLSAISSSGNRSVQAFDGYRNS